MAFVTVYSRPTLHPSDDGDSDNNVTLRARIVDTQLSAAAGTTCRVTFEFGSACPTQTGLLVESWFGQAGGTPNAGSGASNFTGDQVQVKWNGGSATLNGGASVSALSDNFTLAQTWDATKDYVFSAYFDVGTGCSISDISVADNCQVWFNGGGNNAGRTDGTTGFSAVVNNTGMITKIEIDTGGVVPEAYGRNFSKHEPTKLYTDRRLLQRPANDLPTAIIAETNPHFMGKHKPATFFVDRRLLQNRAADLPPAASPIVFRKTLSQIGGRVGTRQVSKGWGN